MRKRKKKIDEFTLERLKKETDFNKAPIVLGGGIVNYEKIRCGKCGEVMTQFEKIYVYEVREIAPGCPNCGTDIFNHTFYPLDCDGKVILGD